MGILKKMPKQPVSMPGDYSVQDIPEWARPFVESLLKALKERDPYTYGHCVRVSQLSRKLAEAAGLNVFQQRVVEFSAIFHDLGKIGISDEVLLKEGRLNPAQEKIMQEHPVKSEEILSPLAVVPFFKAILPGVRSHHERPDGKGYPDGLVGERIPLPARLILVADTFDAMTSDRPYRKALDYSIAFKELQMFAGRQFDEQLVRTFVDWFPQWEKDLRRKKKAVDEEIFVFPIKKTA